MMASPEDRPRILVTGANGFLGRLLTERMRQDFRVRSLDLAECPTADESICGSVDDPLAVTAALEDMESLVIAHMAPNRPEVYATPDIPFDVNVKGTALLFEGAAKRGIKRVVLISSVSVVQRAHSAGEFLSREMVPSPVGMYPLTKHLQEQIAQYYHATQGIQVAMLRPAYICRGDELVDKYGRKGTSVNWQFIDPRDIGAAASLALQLPDLGCETFYLMAGPDADEHADVKHTRERLGWDPQFKFTEFPRN